MEITEIKAAILSTLKHSQLESYRVVDSHRALRIKHLFIDPVVHEVASMAR